MQFIELHRINTNLHIDSRLHGKSTIILESDQLHSHVLPVIQFRLLEFLQQELRIRFQQSMRTSSPRFTLSTQIRIIHIIIAIVHQISLERGSAHRFDIFRNKCKIYIQHIAAFHFRLPINGHLRLHRMLCFPPGTKSGRGCFRCCGIRTRRRLILQSFLGSPGSRSGNIIVVRFNHHTLTHRHRDVKAVGIFHQYNVFSLKSRHNTAAYFAEEAHFISDFHNLLYLSFIIHYPEDTSKP